MSKNNLLSKLSLDELKQLKKEMEQNPNSIMEMLNNNIRQQEAIANLEETIRLEQLEIQKKYEEIQRQTQQRTTNTYNKHFADFDALANKLNDYFVQLTTNSESKDLDTRLHDKLVSLTIEKLIMLRCVFQEDDEVMEERVNILNGQYESLMKIYKERNGLMYNQDEFIFETDKLRLGNIYYFLAKALCQDKDLISVLDDVDTYNEIPGFNVDETNRNLIKNTISQENMSKLYNLIIRPYYQKIGFNYKNVDDLSDDTMFLDSELFGGIDCIGQSELQEFNELEAQLKGDKSK